MICKTPLHVTVWNGRLYPVKMRIDTGAKVGPQPCITPLTLAAKRRDQAIMKILPKCWCQSLSLSGTPMHLATQMGHANAIRLLVHNGAELSVVKVPEMEKGHHGVVANARRRSCWRTFA
ncbi:hypothetical protein VTO42DRAFT_2033 [Malbranchea cinnamomea]